MRAKRVNTMAVIVGSVAYAIAGTVCARLLAGHVAWWLAKRPQWNGPKVAPTGEQWSGAWCCGMLAGFVWPLIAVVALVPTERWAVGAERRELQRQQAERIRQLETELGLK